LNGDSTMELMVWEGKREVEKEIEENDGRVGALRADKTSGEVFNNNKKRTFNK